MVPVRIWGTLSGETRATFKAGRIHWYTKSTAAGGSRAAGNLDEGALSGETRATFKAASYAWFGRWTRSKKQKEMMCLKTTQTWREFNTL